MTHTEIIKVIEHHANGGEVEFKPKTQTEWMYINEPRWNFDKYEYRIKEKPKTKTVWFWKVKHENSEWLMTSYMYTEEEIKRTFTDALEYKRLDILGSEEVPND